VVVGHLVRYFSDRPVIASPFTDGARVLEDTAAFWFATDQRAAEERSAGAGLVLIAQPVTGRSAFTCPRLRERRPPSSEFTAGPWRPVRDTETFRWMIPNRLFFDDGLPSGAAPALDAFRLLWETPTTSPDDPAHEERWMLFERVPGARVRVSGANGPVTASVLLETSTRRRFTWRTEAAFGDGARRASPYASGENAGTGRRVDALRRKVGVAGRPRGRRARGASVEVNSPGQSGSVPAGVSRRRGQRP
jgi:hypothetical protein